MKENFKKEAIVYRHDAMMNPVCLICGERLGSHVYRGKAVCDVCIDYIRANF